jgi:hypothetical protein
VAQLLAVASDKLTPKFCILIRMKLLILYHPHDELSSMVEKFAEECRRKTSKSVELVSTETLEGSNLASLYDLLEYPCVLIIREDDGQLVKHWQGDNLPLIDEVMGNINS